MFYQGKVTTDVNMIKQWVETRNGWPALVKRMDGLDLEESLQIGFPDMKVSENLEKISWDLFFEKFEKNRLVFLYEDQTSSGNLSKLCGFL